MYYTYQNITFLHTKADAAYESGYLPSGEDYSMPLYTIPQDHVIRMIADDYCIQDSLGNNILPHTEMEDYCYINDLVPIIQDFDQTLNTDLFIVYLKWLTEQLEQFIIPITSYNPYWIFHDIAHIDDVHGSEVCCLNSYIEERRFEEGFLNMINSGYIPEFDYLELEWIKNSFYSRWKLYPDMSKFNKYEI